MSRSSKRGEKICQFILAYVGANPKNVASLAAEKFGVTRQTINKYVQQLVAGNLLKTTGHTRGRSYQLVWQKLFSKTYPLVDLQEDVVWRKNIKTFFEQLNANVVDIWHYGLTEILNNAIDHSSGTLIVIQIEQTAISTRILISDDGEGIFRKICREANLTDERHALLELSKGKLTTDPANHSGEGIFFTSRAFDHFHILSGKVTFSHNSSHKDDWLLENEALVQGTAVFMELKHNTNRVLREVFDRFSPPEAYGFSKTIIPVRLAQYGDEALMSRSQAKRLVARVDQFKTVVFDFKGVRLIGQAFADEVFRVFKNKQADINLEHINTNQQVREMILRVESTL